MIFLHVLEGPGRARFMSSKMVVICLHESLRGTSQSSLPCWIGGSRSGPYPQALHIGCSIRNPIFTTVTSCDYFSRTQAKGKTVMYLPAEMMEIGEVSVAAKDKVSYLRF